MSHVQGAGVVETASLYEPLHDAAMSLLRSLPVDDWNRPTVAGRWRVRDVVAHLLDGQLRRLAFHRDGHPFPPPPARLPSDPPLVDVLDALNADWVDAARRLSPRVLMDLLDAVGPVLAAFVRGLDPHAPAFFAVDWAGATPGPAWLDIGRDYTELWHHQAQIRDAVGAPPLLDRRFAHPVFALAVRALPPALRSVRREPGTTVRFEVEGDGGGVWWIAQASSGAWCLAERPDPEGGEPAAAVTSSADVAWRSLFNALTPDEVRRRVVCAGDADLVDAVLRARSVMVAPPGGA